jgi:hypothetical protein
MYSVIKSEIWSQRGWVEITDGIEIVEWTYRLPSWKKERWMIAVRKRLDGLFNIARTTAPPYKFANA